MPRHMQSQVELEKVCMTAINNAIGEEITRVVNSTLHHRLFHRLLRPLLSLLDHLLGASRAACATIHARKVAHGCKTVPDHCHSCSPGRPVPSFTIGVSQRGDAIAIVK